MVTNKKNIIEINDLESESTYRGRLICSSGSQFPVNDLRGLDIKRTAEYLTSIGYNIGGLKK